MNKARDLILELYKDDHITKEEVDLLLDAITQRGDTTYVSVPYERLNPNTPPYRLGDIWCTTNADTTNKK